MAELSVVLLFSSLASVCGQTEVKCIDGGGSDRLNVDEMVTASNSRFAEYKIEECVSFCLLNQPQFSHVLINYHDGYLWDDFKCICANEAAYKRNQVVAEDRCQEHCQGSSYRCGYAHSGMLSVYCLKKGCSEAKADMVCETRQPHDHHGCVKADKVDWMHAHNVRNFSSVSNDHSACVWECRDNHPRSLYSLTRVVPPGGTLTCSCAYVMAFRPAEMVLPEFCKMAVGHSVVSDDYYRINCVADLDEKPEGKHDHGEPVNCNGRDTIGCVYEEILEDLDGDDGNGWQHHFTVSLPSSSSPEKVNVEYCARGCESLFSYDYVYTGVRFDEKAQILSCWCLTKTALNASMMGPEADCFNKCGYAGSQVPCGGFRVTPAVNLFCSLSLKEKDVDPEPENDGYKQQQQQRTLISTPLQLPAVTDVATAAYHDLQLLLQRVTETTAKQNRSSRVVLGLLGVNLFVMAATVVYVCFAPTVWRT